MRKNVQQQNCYSTPKRIAMINRLFLFIPSFISTSKFVDQICTKTETKNQQYLNRRRIEYESTRKIAIEQESIG